MLGLIADWNVVKLNAAIETFARESGRDQGAVIRDQARLLGRDLLKLTPPFKSFSGKESFAEQRRVGMRRVSIDILGAFRPMEMHPLAHSNNPELVQAFDKLVAQKDWLGTEVLTRRTHTPALTGVVAEPTSELHNRARGSRGRVRRAAFSHPTWVQSTAGLKRFIRRKQANVFKAKGGWAPGATAAGFSVPASISRHASGSARDLTKAITNPSFEMRNPVPWGPELDREGRFVKEALSRREQALVRQIQAKMDGRWRDSSRRLAA